MKYVKFAAIKKKIKPHLDAKRLLVYHTTFVGSYPRECYDIPDDKFMLPLDDDFYTSICDGGGYVAVVYENHDATVKKEIILKPEKPNE